MLLVPPLCRQRFLTASTVTARRFGSVACVTAPSTRPRFLIPLSSRSYTRFLSTATRAFSAAAGSDTPVPPGTPWFPRNMSDLDELKYRILEGGDQLEADHPGFNDPAYRRRRERITQKAIDYNYGDQLPRCDYTPEENKVWEIVYDELTKRHPTHACKEYIECFKLMKYPRSTIPQLPDISAVLQSHTGWTMRPVAGLLSARDFLNGLAFKVFHSTQYIRHPSVPLYTPEPDLVHEYMGHAPMFANPAFAEFSQIIGLASLGVSDEAVTKLARNYWFTVEFGLLRQGNGVRAFGAGLLSSFGELEYSLTEKPEVREYDPYAAAQQDYPITCYQPVYYVAKSFEDMQQRMMEFSRTLGRSFDVEWQPNNSVRVVPLGQAKPLPMVAGTTATVTQQRSRVA